MTLDPTVSIGEIISSLSFLVAAVALGLNWWRHKQNNRTNRAILLKDLYFSFFTDPELFGAWEKIDRPGGVSDPDVRNAADRLLGHCDMIATLFEYGSLSRKEMKTFDYVLQRAYKHDVIRHELEAVDTFSDSEEIAGERPFSRFRDYCVSNRFS